MISNTEDAKYLRDNYIVKVIPMLNPGNYYYFFFKNKYNILII